MRLVLAVLSQIKMTVIFGAANLAMRLVVMKVTVLSEEAVAEMLRMFE